MVVPLWDDNPLKFKRLPYVTWSLMAANILVFVAQASAPPAVVAMLESYALTPAALTGALIPTSGPPPYVTLVTYMFLHGGLLHLFGNMIFLWIFGDDVEEATGPLRFLAFYLASGILGGLAYVASGTHSTIPLVGASGAIAGVLAAYLMFRPCQKVLVFVPWFVLWLFVRPVVRLDAFWVLGAWVLTQFWHLSQSPNEVAYVTHVGGLITGAVLFPFLRSPLVRLFECFRPAENPAPPGQTR